MRDGKPVLMRPPRLSFNNNKGGGSVRFGLLLLHDDAAREYAYGQVLSLPTPQLGAFTPAL